MADLSWLLCECLGTAWLGENLRSLEQLGDGLLQLMSLSFSHSFQQIMHYHMQNEQYKKVIEVCELYGDQEACLWEQALGYFARKEEDCKEYIAAVLKHIENKNLMPPLLGNNNMRHLKKTPKTQTSL